jgi:hypothetical protein
VACENQKKTVITAKAGPGYSQVTNWHDRLAHAFAKAATMDVPFFLRYASGFPLSRE